eukprot:jgi/Mesvir1/28577/Mv00992-RA.1
MAASTMRVIVVAVTLAVVQSAQGIVTTASKVDGVYPYDPATVPLLVEFTKLIVSSGLLLCAVVRRPSSVRITSEWRTCLRFLVPSLLYLVQNNLSFLTLRHLDPAAFQILANLKIISTGILFTIILKRHLSRFQWLALLLVPLAAFTSQLSGCQGGPLLKRPPVGYLLGIAGVCLSSLANVYSEYVLKQNDDSLYWQNLQLYSFGVLFNMLHLALHHPDRYLSMAFWARLRIFEGYSAWTAGVVAVFSLSGLLVSWIIKFSDNIIKSYASSLEMVTTMAASFLLFGTRPTAPLIVAILIIAISMQFYFLLPAHLEGAAGSPAGGASPRSGKLSYAQPDEEAVPLLPISKCGDQRV